MAEYGVSSRAQFFKTPTKELAYVSGGKFIEIYPKNTVSESSKNPIIFEWGPMSGYSYNFRDSRLVFKLKIANGTTGAAPAANNKLVRPVNGIGVLFFKRMQLFLNNFPVHTNLMDIGLKTLIDTMIERPKNTENNDILWGHTYLPLEDKILAQTSQIFDADKVQELRGWTTFIVKIPLDFCRTTVNIPCLEHVSWELRLYPHDNDYVLNYGFVDPNAPEPELGANWVIKLKDDIKLRLRCDKFSHETAQAHVAETLNSNIPYKIHYKPTVVRSYTIPPEQKYLNLQDIFPREKPVAIYVTFLTQEAFLGSKQHNPCYFHPGDGFESLAVYSNGELIGEHKPLKISMDDPETLKELYNHNRNVIGLDDGDQDLFWSHKDLARGYFLWGVPIRPTSEAEGLVPMLDETIISANISYKTDVAKTDTMVVLFYAIMTLNELKIYFDGSILNEFSM